MSNSYIEGYRCGYYDGSHIDDNPYVPSEGMYDYHQWRAGWEWGRFDWREGNQPEYRSAEN